MCGLPCWRQEDKPGGRRVRQLGAVHLEKFLQEREQLRAVLREIDVVRIDLRAPVAHFEFVATKFEMPVSRLRILREVLAELHLPHVALAQGHPHEQLEDHPALKATGPLRPREAGGFAVGTSGARPSARQASATASIWPKTPNGSVCYAGARAP